MNAKTDENEVSLELIGDVAIAMGLISKLPAVLNKLNDLQAESLIEYTSSTRVEPVVLFDESLMLQSYISDVFQSLVNIFAGYYLQAIAVTCNVGSIEVRKLLGKLSPDRRRNPVQDVVDRLSLRYMEGIDIGLERVEDWEKETWEREEEARKGRRDVREEEKAYDEDKKATREEEIEKRNARKYRIEERRARERADREKEELKARQKDRKYKEDRDIKEDRYRKKKDREEDEKYKKVRLGASKSSIDDLNTNVNLSAGKTISVEIESEGSRALIPVNIRLIVKNCPSSALANFLTVIKSDRRVKTRWGKWRSGEISFFRDLLMCQDIIDEEKKMHMTDKEGLFRNLRQKNRKNENNIYDIVTDNVNVANASSIIVMSKETAKGVELALSGKLDSFRVREQLFSITFTMMILVIDTQWEKITMYHRSIDEPSVLSVRDFRVRGKDSGPDINEILMAYRAGSAPTF